MKMRIINVIMAPILFVALFGCSDTASKKEAEKNANTKTSEPTSFAVEEFESFFAKFNKDSVFQLSRIAFPLKFKSSEGEKSVINKAEWKFTRLVEAKDSKAIIRKKVISQTEVRIDYMEQDTGVLVSHIFLEKEGLWMLVNIEDHST